MSVYRFFDTNIANGDDCDITGERYKELLKICFRYCATVSFLVRSGDTNSAQLDKITCYQLEVPREAENLYGHYGKFENGIGCDNSFGIKCYRLSKTVQDFVLKVTDSIFKWTYWWGFKNPDDLAFLRPDGSVFFTRLYTRESAQFVQRRMRM